MKWRLLLSAFKFGCDRALPRERAQSVVDRAGEFKADICAGLLTCPSAVGELSWQSRRVGSGVIQSCAVSVSSANSSIMARWHATVGAPSGAFVDRLMVPVER